MNDLIEKHDMKNNVASEKTYKAYIYSRLSKDEYGQKKESMENQIDICTRYANLNGFNVVKLIEDDDISGYKFAQRDGLQEIKEAIIDGECNMVIAKDLSRLGRDNAHILFLIDFFDDHDVRYVLPNENFDSLTGDRSMLGIKAWYNDFYGRDISNKMKGTLREIQMKVGLIILPPYGYKKVFDEVGNKLIEIDDVAAMVVREIFDLYLSGRGVKIIAMTLNERGRPTPNQRNQHLYKKQFKKNSTGLWYHSTIKKIITNEAYIGTLVNRKTECRKISTGLKRQLPIEENIRHEGYFEPIIDVETYYRAQRMNVEKSKNNIRVKGKKSPHLFSGYLTCGDCGNAMYYNTSKKAYVDGELRVYGSYICGHYHKFGIHYCTRHAIKEDDLKEIVLDEIKSLAELARDSYDDIDNELAKIKRLKVNHESTLESLVNNQKDIENKIENYINEKVAGRIPESMANKFIQQATSEHDIVSTQIKEVMKLKEVAEITDKTVLKSIDVLDMILSKKIVSRQDVEMLVERISVFDNDIEKSIVIDWKAPFNIHKVRLNWQK